MGRAVRSIEGLDHCNQNNSLDRSFAVHQNGVLASPIADRREALGIKTREDVARCEQFIIELESE